MNNSANIDRFYAHYLKMSNLISQVTEKNDLRGLLSDELSWLKGCFDLANATED